MDPSLLLTGHYHVRFWLDVSECWGVEVAGLHR